MRVTVCWFGYELDFSFGPTTVDDEPFEPYQDAGITGSTTIGFTQSARPAWERPLNHWDEPSEGDEDV